MTATSKGAGPDQKIDVSVLLITYNHASFIRAAAQSVLSQQTDRSFELIISEDASTDGTREAVEQLSQEDGRIRLILSTKNLRSNQPVRRAIDAARGRYLCILDGDDRWLVNDKIERQASLLDEHPEFSACFHNALIAHGDENEPTDERWTLATVGPRVTFKELWDGNPFATCAGMLRKSALARIENWYVDCFPITDWPLYLLCAEQGDVLFADEPVGLYRLHRGGEVSGLEKNAQLRLIARFYRQMAKVRDGEWAKMAQSHGSLFFSEKARQFIANRDFAAARFSLKLALEEGGVGSLVSWRTWLRLARRSIW